MSIVTNTENLAFTVNKNTEWIADTFTDINNNVLNGHYVYVKDTDEIWYKENGLLFEVTKNHSTGINTNMYTTDGTLTSNRLVTMGSNTLSFEKDVKINDITIGKGGSSISNNTAIGKDALKDITTGNQSVAVGFEALKSATNTGLNTAVGYRALASLTNNPPEFPLTVSNFSTAVGYAALEASVEDTDNTAVGYAAMRTCNGGDFNTGIGYAALGNVTTGRDNIALGWRALGSLTNGQRNVGVGYNPMPNLTSGDANVCVGYENFGQLTSAIGTTSLGFKVAPNGSGGRNTVIGWQAMTNATTDDWNTVIGASAGANMNGAGRCTVIGANVSVDSPTAYNEIYIGDGGGNVRIKHNGGRLKFPDFGAGTQTGIQVYNLQVTSNGSIIETKAIPNPPTVDGTYNLQCTVIGGVTTYNWI